MERLIVIVIVISACIVAAPLRGEYTLQIAPVIGEPLLQVRASADAVTDESSSAGSEQSLPFDEAPAGAPLADRLQARSTLPSPVRVLSPDLVFNRRQNFQNGQQGGTGGFGHPSTKA